MSTDQPSEADSPAIPRNGTFARRVGMAVLKLGVGIALFVGVLFWIAPDWAELRAIVTIVPLGLGVALLGTTLASLVTAYRWKLLAETVGGNPLPFGVYMHALVLTRFLGQFVPTLAMDLVGRGVALRSAGSKKGLGHAATQVVVERLLDVVLPVTLVAWAVLTREWTANRAGLALALTCSLLVATVIPLLHPMVRVALAAYTRLRTRTGRFSAEEAAEAASGPIPAEPKIAAWVAGLSLARFATVTLQFLGAAMGVGLAIPALSMLAATAVAQIAGLIGFTPGGLGIVEVGWAGGLRFVGRPEVEIGLFVLAQRLCVISNFGLLSLLTLPWSGRSGRSGRSGPSAPSLDPQTPDDDDDASDGLRGPQGSAKPA